MERADNREEGEENFPNSAYENTEATVADHHYEELQRNIWFLESVSN